MKDELFEKKLDNYLKKQFNNITVLIYDDTINIHNSVTGDLILTLDFIKNENKLTKLYGNKNYDYNEIFKSIKIFIESKKYKDKNDNQYDNIKPNHYLTKSGKQLMDLLKEDLLSDTEFIGFLKGNLYKYVFRYERKNKEEDLKKAQFYLKELKKYEYKD